MRGFVFIMLLFISCNGAFSQSISESNVRSSESKIEDWKPFDFSNSELTDRLYGRSTPESDLSLRSSTYVPPLKPNCNDRKMVILIPRVEHTMPVYKPDPNIDYKLKVFGSPGCFESESE